MLRGALATATLIGFPLWVHAAVVMEKPQWGAYALPAFYLLQRLAVIGRWRLPSADWLVLAVLMTMVIVGAALGRHAVIYLPPIAITTLVFLTFARSLAAGATPLVTRIAHAVGDSDPALARYTHKLTWAWTLLLGALVAETIILPFAVSQETWSLFCNLLNYLIIALFAMAEFVYRKVRFRPEYGLLGYLRRLARVDLRRV